MNYILKISFCLLLSIPICSFAAEHLSIVSWNLKDFGQSRDANEIRLIALEIRNADIVAIQEVVAKHPGGAQAVARLADELNRMGAKWDYRISDPTDSPSGHISERYAFLWKTSEVSITGGRPVLVSELSKLVHREPYKAQFKTKSGEILTLINYHACTHKKHNPERAEIKAVSNWLVAQQFANVIWTGDMNLVYDDEAFEHLTRVGYKSVLHGEKTSLKMECKSGNYLSRAEDNIFYKFSTLDFAGGRVLDFVGDLDCHEVVWKRTSYSDHLGVEVKVGL